MKIQTRSMTGFGKGQAEGGGVSVDVEIRAFNHRFLDFSFRAPAAYAPLEAEVRSIVASKIERGKVELLVNRRAQSTLSQIPVLNRDLFDSLFALYRTVLEEQRVGSPGALDQAALEILSRRDVISCSEESFHLDSERELLGTAVGKAVEALKAMRSIEGERIGLDIAQRLGHLSSIRDRILALTAESPVRHRERLLQRIQKLAPEVKLDETRLVQEVAYIVDRLDVTEELTRLESHLAQFRTLLGTPPNGRRLEFLLQELGREINTISSKCQDAAIQALAIDAKADLEKMREQIQNVE